MKSAHQAFLPQVRKEYSFLDAAKASNNTAEEKLEILHADQEGWWSVKPVNDLKKILEMSQKEFDDFKISEFKEKVRNDSVETKTGSFEVD